MVAAAAFQVSLLAGLAAAAAVAQITPSPIPVVEETAISPAPVSVPVAAETNRSGVTINYYAPLLYMCNTLTNYNWDNVKYACSWTHNNYGEYFNLFFKTYDGRYERECHCMLGLNSYDPWGSRWAWSQDADVRCYTRDGRSAAQVKSEFDTQPFCGEPPVRWIW